MRDEVSRIDIATPVEFALDYDRGSETFGEFLRQAARASGTRPLPIYQGRRAALPDRTSAAGLPHMP